MQLWDGRMKIYIVVVVAVEQWGLVKGKKEEKTKDVPSALMQCLQHGSCSSQKEERGRANKHWPLDSEHLLHILAHMD